MIELTNGFPVHYRYDDYMYKDGVEVKVSKFYPIRETRCFYLVINQFENNLKDITKGRELRTKRVSKDGVRRYCYPTKQEALHSYKKRKLAQIGHAELAMAKAQQVLFAIKDKVDDFDNLDCGRPDYWDNINFE